MSHAHISVLSSYTEVDEDPTPRAPQNEVRSAELSHNSAEQDSYRPLSYLQQFKSELTKKEQTGLMTNQSTAKSSHQKGLESQTNQNFSNPQQESVRYESTRGFVVQSVTSESKQSPKSKTSPKIENQPKIVGTVAPKPPRPNKNFIEKNIEKARGVSSAKSSYTSRLMQAKKEQEVRKDWAPGMVIPRKKAASADNAVRAHKPENNFQEPESPTEKVKQAFSEDDIPSAQSVWEQRSAQLTDTKSKKHPKQHKKTPRQLQAPPKMDNPSRINVHMDLQANPNFGTPHHGLRLIGPIPQQSSQPFSYTSPRSYATPSVGNIQGYQTPSGRIQEHQIPAGPIQGHQPFTGSIHGHQPLAGPIQGHQPPAGPIQVHQPPTGPIQGHPAYVGPAQYSSVITGHNATGPIYRPHHNHNLPQTYHPYPTTSGVVQNDLDPNQNQYWTDTVPNGNELANDSYYQSYQQNHQKVTDIDYQHNSRWNSQRVIA